MKTNQQPNPPKTLVIGSTQTMRFSKALSLLAIGLAFLFSLLVETEQANAANVRVKVDLSSQKMYVTVNGWRRHTWPVSTARRGYRTPVGNYRPTRTHKMWYSKKYHNSPMPYSIFFHGGYAIHGTKSIKRLGSPASHGCVRLHPDNARKLYKLVQTYGKYNTHISITR